MASVLHETSELCLQCIYIYREREGGGEREGRERERGGKERGERERERVHSIYIYIYNILYIIYLKLSKTYTTFQIALCMKHYVMTSCICFG